jgi:hypothetical protein
MQKAISNIIVSGSKYLLTPSFVDCKRNNNMATGEWRPINLEIPPYNFSIPLLILNEYCTQDDGAFPYKSLVLWEIKALSSTDFPMNYYLCNPGRKPGCCLSWFRAQA